MSAARQRGSQAARSSRSSFIAVSAHWPVLVLLAGLVGSGCQTFSLTEEQFHAQQHGGAADPEAAMYVDVAGTAGYAAGTLAAAIASALK